MFSRGKLKCYTGLGDSYLLSHVMGNEFTSKDLAFLYQGIPFMKCTTKILIKSYFLAYDLIRIAISCQILRTKELRAQARQLTLPAVYALLSLSLFTEHHLNTVIL